MNVATLLRMVLGLAFAISLACGVRTPAAAATCTGSVYHQLDFFVGDWIVENKAGKQIATDRVSRAYGGCVIWEQWFGGDGSRGAGYSGYDAVRNVWVQTFMDDSKTVLVFEGGMIGKAFVIGGKSYPKAGIVEQNRVAFTTSSAGVVEEYWTVSDDGGKTKKVVFDGFFHRKA